MYIPNDKTKIFHRNQWLKLLETQLNESTTFQSCKANEQENIIIKLWGLVYKTAHGTLPPFNGLNYPCFHYRLNFRSYQDSKVIRQWTIILCKHLNYNKSFFVGNTFLVERFVQPKKNIQVFKPTNNRLVLGTSIISSPMTHPCFVYTKL